MAEEHRLQEPRLCANNCGFFGSTATQNLCSKCFRDLQHQQQNSSSAKHALNQTLAAAASAVSSPGGASSSSVSPPPTSLPQPDPKTNPEKRAATEAVEEEEEEEEAPPQDPKRCLTCRRRVGITGFRCRCGFVFCGTHRYAEQHECSFDFKRMGKEKIAKANPIVKADKLEKI